MQAASPIGAFAAGPAAKDIAPTDLTFQVRADASSLLSLQVLEGP